MPCKLCRYTFKKEHVETPPSLLGSTNATIISLVRNSDNKTVSRLRISETVKAMSLDFMYSPEPKKGHGSRLIRLIQSIAKKLNKPIHVNAAYNAVEFFQHRGFVLDHPDKPIDELNLMTWTP
jgi:hypothetical protein